MPRQIAHGTASQLFVLLLLNTFKQIGITLTMDAISTITMPYPTIFISNLANSTSLPINANEIGFTNFQSRFNFTATSFFNGKAIEIKLIFTESHLQKSGTHIQVGLRLPMCCGHTRDQHATQCAGRWETNRFASQHREYSAAHHHQKANCICIILKCYPFAHKCSFPYDYLFILNSHRLIGR